ncbi:MAG TPA: CDP-alcohol phosphatidyltransferase family protein, partial [Roseiflexaceae bacterium]|nr:CDP-alcohol phosphatidyltransferase family protein [Roseiflexaceae bacterium]
IPVAVLLVRGQYLETLFVFGIAAITDGLDGFLAKRFNWTSELGKALDPLADKILLVTAFVALTFIGDVPLWLTAPVVLRDVIITAGAIVYVNVMGPLTEAKPTVISKLNTFVQIGYVLTVVAAPALNRSWDVAIIVLATLVIVTTVASGIDYIATYTQRSIDVSRARRGGKAR